MALFQGHFPGQELCNFKDIDRVKERTLSEGPLIRRYGPLPIGKTLIYKLLISAQGGKLLHHSPRGKYRILTLCYSH